MCVLYGCLDEGVKLPRLSRCEFCPSRLASVSTHASTGVCSNTASLFLNVRSLYYCVACISLTGCLLIVDMDF